MFMVEEAAIHVHGRRWRHTISTNNSLDENNVLISTFFVVFGGHRSEGYLNDVHMFNVGAFNSLRCGVA